MAKFIDVSIPTPRGWLWELWNRALDGKTERRSEDWQMDVQQARFDGWAIVEMMGHQREIGYVTTEYLGGAALFRVDTPELPEREETLKRPTYTGSRGLLPAGTTVKRTAIPARSRLVSPGALYAITPCTEATARRALEDMVERPLIVLSIPERTLQAAPAGFEQRQDGEEVNNLACPECRATVGHELTCPRNGDPDDEEYEDDEEEPEAEPAAPVGQGGDVDLGQAGDPPILGGGNGPRLVQS